MDFQSIEHCASCMTRMSLEWVPPVICMGRPLAGTGQWCSRLTGGRCADCNGALRRKIAQRQCELDTHLRLRALGGGEKPYREFRFDSYRVGSGNERAFHCAQTFDPRRDNLYLWGVCGVGKTHLAFAAARGFCEQGLMTEFVKPSQLLRKVRHRDPNEEEQAINRFVRADVFVLDDLGIGNESAYARQVFQEILDGRDFSYRAGLIITSRYSLDGLAAKLDDDSIPSRVAGLCRIAEIKGPDVRFHTKRPDAPQAAPLPGASEDI